jgi:DNA repair exonuclease SbcCD ATPase subunit
VDREPMSDLVKRLREAAQEVAAEGHFGWGNRMQIAADRIEELERALRFIVDLVERLKQVQYEVSAFDGHLAAMIGDAMDRIEELERALENLCIHVGMGWETDEVLEKARAALEKKQ